ncbi:mothers against decapentaplegic homolog 6-like isoform X1 [Takifugu rubripes]|uniref:Mothers against decapentaplegic homolog n=1 Tax=Takifugu rubripes TaxID=31033 RepID=A0A3B5JYC3_TAKRU|nr:mothers against decapentaplegic homolog 6-like isoform X1 [Takifugu rubripes]|eukprot:XP_011608288.1 PREDICTED: mothers against decapentaplegic homolog 6-like isoform X1 [Takifugu rubripes]
MFKSRRSGLVRRLWRSRLVTESDGRDGSRRGEGGRKSHCDRHSGKLHRHEPRSVTHADPAPGLTGDGGDLTEGAEREEEEQSEDDRGAMCAPEHRGSQQGQDGDSRTVTCCLFGEWDLRPRSPYCASRKDGGEPCQCASRHGDREDELGSTAHAFLKRLKDGNLEALARTIETKGSSECVMVTNTELRLGAHHVSPQYLLCKMYRWSDLPFSARLKPLCHCQSFGSVENTNVCCNPYHYSRLCGPESPPPPYTLSCSDEHKPLDSTLPYTETAPPPLPSAPHIAPREYTDTGTSLDSSASSGHRSHWCSVAYWEQRTRVGRLYPAFEPSLNIFYDLPQGTGLCLSQLHANAYHTRRGSPGGHGQHSHGSGGNSSSSVQQIRSKIGYGIMLSREPDGVWVYNRSQHPVFVHSPTLDPPSARGLSVKRVMPGFSLKVFDYEHSSWMAEHGVKPESQEGPWDPHSVRISFAKGWGPCYSRQFITSCPCWLEVLLNNHR